MRGLAELLPELETAAGCPFNCPPAPAAELCFNCQARWAAGEEVETVRMKVEVVELPVGATEDRVLGTLDLEKALTTGRQSFSPGLLARANRNILYVDEVNLLDDHLVDVLLDSAAMGVNTVEREGISVSHPARFTLVGTMNPEEGELRPQLLDRFGLCVLVEGISDPLLRAEVVRRRLAFENSDRKFLRAWRRQGRDLTRRMIRAKRLLKRLEVADEAVAEAVRISLRVGTDGHRADLTMIKAARAMAAFEGRGQVEPSDLAAAARLALPHRLRRKPFEDMVFDLAEVLGEG